MMCFRSILVRSDAPRTCQAVGVSSLTIFAASLSDQCASKASKMNKPKTVTVRGQMTEEMLKKGRSRPMWKCQTPSRADRADQINHEKQRHHGLPLRPRAGVT